VADEIIRRGCVPVLLVRSGGKAPEILTEPALDDVLIPLDGSSLAERVLAPALDLARLMEARCTLLRVVESGSSSAGRSPGGSPERAPAEAYLECVATKVRERGLQVRTRVVVARHAAGAILEEAAAREGTLIALATHGRAGLKRLLLGSVTDKVIRGSNSPVLVCPPGSGGRAV
jgi:nucleotide-binding universal stress UspA family protein